MEWKTFYLFNSMLTLKNWLLTGEDFRLFFKSPIEKNSNNNPLLHVFTQTSIRHLIVDFARVYRAVDPGGGVLQLIWGMKVCAVPKSMVFQPFWS